jgi:hypothetical protein
MHRGRDWKLKFPYPSNAETVPQRIGQRHVLAEEPITA